MATTTKVTNAGRGIDGVPGANKLVYRDFTFSASYTTGGEAAPSLASLGLSKVFFVEVEASGGKNAAGTSLLPVAYDRVNHKVQAYRYDGASAGKAFLEEVSAAVDLSTFTVRLRFEGRTATT